MNRFFGKSVLAVVAAAFVALSVVAGESDNFARKPSPDAVLTQFKQGNKRFVTGKFRNPNRDAARRHLASRESQGKYALATVLTCSDSRVPAELIFDSGIMDIFVIRVAGNVCNTDEVGSIEYGLCHVNTPLLIILGHSQCGAVTAVFQDAKGHGHKLETNIPPLVASIVPAVKGTLAKNPKMSVKEALNACIEANVWQAIDNLFKKSAATRKVVRSGKVKVVGAIYDIDSGKVKWLSSDKVTALLKKEDKNAASEKHVYAAR
jgi:carbonic anhydrase